MKLLFILLAQATISEQILQFKIIEDCSAAGFSVFIITLQTDKLVPAPQPSRSTLRHRVILQDNDHSMISAHTAFNQIVSLLREEQFKPDLIELFHYDLMSYLLLQNKLLDIGISNQTKIVVNLIADPLSGIPVEKRYTLPGFFEISRWKFILHAADLVCCYHTSIDEPLQQTGKFTDLDIILPKLINLSPGHDVKEKYTHTSLSTSCKKKNYPFARESRCYPLISKHPLLSIIIPYYNMGEYIAETLQSAYNTLYEPIEVIIINDGSTDTASLTELEIMKQKYESLVVIQQQNTGVAEARNNGIRLAKGEIIALLDADDVIEPSYYTKAVKILTDFENVNFTGCWATLFDKTGAIDQWITYNPELPLYFLMNTFTTQAIVVKKQAIIDHGLHDPNLNMMLDDWESVIGMLVHGVHGVAIPEFLFHYRIRRNSLLRTHQKRWTESYNKIIQKHTLSFTHHTKEVLLLLNTNGPPAFYKDPLKHSDYYQLMNNLTNYRIRNSLLTKWVNRYYDLVEMNPVGIKIRKLLTQAIKKSD